MITTAAALGVIAVALGMVLTPGPNMIYLISRSVSQGWRAGLWSLGGTILGFLVYLAAANLGLAAIFLLVPWLYTAVKLAGAGYLIYLAWRTLRPGGLSAFEPKEGLPKDSPRRLFTMGLVTNLLNPKAAIMYLALIPQFLDPVAGNLLAQGFALGGLQILVSAIVNAVIVLTAGGLAVFLSRRPLWLRTQRWVTGSVLGGLGVSLALDSAKPAAVTP